MSGMGTSGSGREIPCNALLPWTEAIWSRLQAARAANRLAHGLLISGPLGVGKRPLAETLARALLCRAPGTNGIACGLCADCRLLAAGNHPDLIRVGPDPESKSGEIPIAVIREFTERESLTPSRAAWKVALIDPADRLNPAAANALLKTLEEPTGQTLLCLIAERMGALPATVRSRCLQIKVPIPETAQALAWLKVQRPATDWTQRLQLARGAPRRALGEFDEALLEQHRQRLAGLLAIAAGKVEPIAEAADWETLGAVRMLEWLAGWICDLARLMAGAQAFTLYDRNQEAAFAELARRLDPMAVHRFLQRILDGRRLIESNLNQRLLLESLAIDWFRLTRATTSGAFDS